MQPVEVFFHGLFMDEGLLQSKGLKPRRMRRGSVLGFVLRIGQRATLVRSSTDTVHGMVASLTDRELEHLYSEPGVREYRAEHVLVHEPNGSSAPALCFNLATEPAPSPNRKLRRSAQVASVRLGQNLPSQL